MASQEKAKKVGAKWWDNAEQVVVDQLPLMILTTTSYTRYGVQLLTKKLLVHCMTEKNGKTIALRRGKVMTV